MAKRYAYRPGRKRSVFAGLWVVLPLALVIGALYVNAQLPEDGGRFLTRAACSGEGCETAVLSAEPCATSGGCAELGLSDIDVDSAPVGLTAAAAVVIEEPCGALLYELNDHDPRAPASITKIATALVVAERADLDEIVDVQVDGPELSVTTDSTIMGLQPGVRLSVRDLLYGLMLPSGNDAAIALAEHVAGSVPAFVELMNARAAELGLEDTHFANPHGLDEFDHYTSALDIATFGRELLRRPELAEIVRTTAYQPAWDGPAIGNGNRLLTDYPGSIGVKIGYTDDAGQTIVAAVERGSRRILVSVLGSQAVYQDAVTLFEWAFGETPSACHGQGGGG